MSAEVLGSAAPLSGRTAIRPQAIRRVAEAVAAELAGVPAERVSAELSDWYGRLSVSVTTPLDPAAGVSAADTIVTRAAAIVDAVASRVDALTGRTVGRVDVRFSGIRTTKERRVR